MAYKYEHDFQVTSTGQITAAPLVLAKTAKANPESSEQSEGPIAIAPGLTVATERDARLMQAIRINEIMDGGEHE